MTLPEPRESAPTGSLTARYLSPTRTLVRAAIALVGALFAAVVLVAALVVVQGRSADLRHADAIVIVGAPCGEAGTECADAAALDHALDLFRRGYATRVLVAAENAEAARAHLLAAGLPADALLEDAGGGSAWQRARAAAATLRAQSISAALLTGTQSDMLVALKMTRDLGLTVYPAPAASEGRIPPVGVLLSEAGAYWRYVLLGE